MTAAGAGDVGPAAPQLPPEPRPLGQAELDAVAAASFHQAVIRASPDIVSVYDLSSRTAVWANRSMTSLLGYTDEEVAQWTEPEGDGLASRVGVMLVHEEDRASLEGALDAVHHAVDDTVHEIEFRVRHMDGSLRWFAQRMAPLSRDDGGKVTRMVGVCRDITQAKASESALHESEVRFRQLADNVDVGFVLRSWDDPPQYLYVNPAFERIFGWNPLTLPEHPKNPFAYIHPEDLDHFLEHYWVPATKALATQAEYRIVRPDGEVRWVRSILSPVRDATGRVRRTASTTEDITSSRQAAAAIIAAQAAEEANAAKNEFLSRMSHELRTPLNAVMGFAQLLELDDLSTDQMGAVRHIIRGGRHLVGLIDDVLDISKIEGDRLDMSIEMVPVSRLLDETVDLMVPQAAAAGVGLTSRTNAAVGRSVRADHRRLRQVVLNLLSNAIKYNRPGGTVEVTCGSTPQGWLDIVVTDTGRGIRSADLPRLFVPFDRLDAGANDIEGTGVGLALSQRLMIHMGGTLTATSRFGEGSAFTASMPLCRPAAAQRFDGAEHADVAGDASRIRESPAGPDDTASKRTLLYIEDNSSNIALMEQVVARRSGWGLLVAGHGGLGLELAASTDPDLVLLDLHLPDMNGVEVLRRFGPKRDGSPLDVVVISADANPHQVDRLLEAGARDYLTKPLDVDKILALLDATPARSVAT